MNIVHRVGIKAPAAQVYAALTTINGLAGWWTRDTSGKSAPGGRIDFLFRKASGETLGGFGMQVQDLSPQQRVLWRVVDGPPEWVGTEVEFVLTEEDDYTIVNFDHRQWRDNGAFMAHCSTKWATFLLSLRDLVETGRGHPAPQDVQISNWH